MEEVQPYVVSQERLETHVSIVDIASVRHRSATREEDKDFDKASFTRCNPRMFTEKLLSWKLSIRLFNLI